MTFEGLSPFVCACFTLNYLIGTGFLTLPWAFEAAGILLSVVTMALTCLVANLASDYILSAMARAQAITTTMQSQENNNESKALLSDINKENRTTLYQSVVEVPDNKATNDESRRTQKLLVEFDDTASAQAQAHSMDNDEAYYDHVKKYGKLLIGDRKFELTELCQLFLGDAGLLAYGISASLDIYGFLWAYASVFGNAMSKLLPLGLEDDYVAWLAIFAIIVAPMSLLHLSEQATVQVFLSACRIAVMLLMVGTPLAATIFHHKPHFGTQTEPAGTVWVDFGNTQKMFPAIVFCLLFHQAVPGLADEMQDTTKVGIIFGYTFMLCGLAYSLVGIVGAFYFGNETSSSANINWTNYHGGTGTFDETSGVWVDAAQWAQVIKVFVVSFPAIDVVSAFPIYAYVLGNTLMGLFHASNIQEIQRNRKILTFYRSIAALPPIVGAAFLRELGTITDYSGLVGLAIAFCFPPILYMASEKRLKEQGAPYRTRYERMGTSKWTAVTMFWFGVISIVTCFVLLTFYS